MNIRPFVLLAIICLLCVKPEAQEIRQVKITELGRIIAESNHPLLVNFWATWCKPCVEEIPAFIREVKAHKADSLQLILVSLDDRESFPEKLRNFINFRKYEGTFLWLDETNADYFCPKIDTAWSGAIPASLFINKKSGYRAFFETKLTDKQVQMILMGMFSPSAFKQ